MRDCVQRKIIIILFIFHHILCSAMSSLPVIVVRAGEEGGGGGGVSVFREGLCALGLDQSNPIPETSFSLYKEM